MVEPHMRRSVAASRRHCWQGGVPGADGSDISKIRPLSQTNALGTNLCSREDVKTYICEHKKPSMRYPVITDRRIPGNTVLRVSVFHRTLKAVKLESHHEGDRGRQPERRRG